MPQPSTIVFAGGGTGGHLFPALAVLEYLSSRHDIETHFLCTSKSVDSQILSQRRVPHTRQPVRPLSTRLWKIPGFIRAWRRSIELCTAQFERQRPDVVVGSGGYGSGPAVYSACKQHIPVALLNPDAIPGRANRFLAKKADHIYVQWDETCAHFPGSDRVFVTGCPVRRAFLKPPDSGNSGLFGLSPDRRTLVITGASLGAHSINAAMCNLAPELARHRRWQVLHISGRQDEETVRRAYASANVPACVLPFTEDMADALRSATLVIARAGAVTLAELAAVRKPAILMPYPYHKDQHQRSNAQALVHRGAALLLDDHKDAQLNARNLMGLLVPLMESPQRLKEMATRYPPPRVPSAAELISQHLLELAQCTSRF